MPVLSSSGNSSQIRLASFNDLAAFMKGGAEIAPGSEQYTAANYILDGVSRRMANYILRSNFYSFSQVTSDGISSALEFYGTEHYGWHDRSIIRLHRFPLVSVSSIIDNQSSVDSTQYVLDYEESTIMRIVGKFYRQRKAVQVIYTAGFAATGAGDSGKLNVYEDLRNACLLQAKYEYSRWQPGGVPPAGATTISRPDGSIIVPAQAWLTEVKDVMDGYRRTP
jgi:hypothetical protein